AGRRPALASRRGLDVWQVISTLHDNDGNIADTADVLRPPQSEVRGALGYYADYRGAIDDGIRTNEELLEHSPAAAKRHHEAARQPGRGRIARSPHLVELRKTNSRNGIAASGTARSSRRAPARGRAPRPQSPATRPGLRRARRRRRRTRSCSNGVARFSEA